MKKNYLIMDYVNFVGLLTKSPLIGEALIT